MPTEYRSRTKIAETLTEFVVVENTQAAPKSDTRAVENDRILQQRLQQAKALERKNETNGAVMFKFALWGKPKDTATAHDNDDAATTQDTTAQPKSGSKLRGPKIARENQLGGETAATTSATLDEEATAISLFPPSMIPVQPAVPRTPQRVLRSQSVPTTPATVTLLQAKTPMAPPNTVAPVKPSTATGAPTTTTTTHNIHHDDDYDESYSDDDFERTGDEDSRSHHSTITANAAVTITATVTASAGNNEASAANDEPVRSHSNEQALGISSGSNQPAVRNLAMALRTLVVEAKSMGSEYSSPAQSGSDPHRDPHQHLSPQPSQNTIHDTAAVEDDVDVENSYSSFVLLSQQQKQLSALSQSVGEDIPPVEDEDSSDDWNDSPEDDGRRGGGGGGGVRRSFSAEHLDGCDTPQSIQTVMSKSGPAAFLSSMSSISSSVADASKAPAAQAAQGPSVSGNTEPVTIGGGATSSFNRNRRANSCGVSEMRTTMQGIAYNKESGGGDGAAAMATATAAAADGGGGGDLPGSLTSLTSRDERKPTGKLTPTTVPQSQTPESYRYSSRPEASTHSRYQAMRQTREAMKRSSATTLTKDPADSSSAAMATSSSPAPASTTTSPEQAGGGAGGTHERDEVPSWSSADGNSSGLPSYGDRGYYSSPDNHSLSVGGDVEGIPPSRSTAANGQSVPSALQGDGSADADFCTPRLTEMSDSEDEILGIRKSAAAAGGGHVPAVESGVVAGRVAVTPLNPTGNPFHRFAEPVRGSGGGNAATTATVSAVNGNGLAAMPPLASQPQPVVPIAEFLATISSRTNAAAATATATATTTTTTAVTAATATAITATTAAAVTATASTLSVDTAAPKTPATAASSGAPTAAATTTAAAASSLDEKPSSPLKWIKGDVIGEGTFGKVYKGLNQSTGELLAIKQFYLADGSEEEVDDLQKEIAVMWELDHEHIVRYLGTSKTDRFLYIVLEYVTGGSIASMLAQYGPFTESLIRRFSLHILSGMQYLHSQGIIHRDIKGANILVTDAGIAKLADFGCSKRLAGLCTTSLEESMHIMRGSVPWMAPEVIKQAGYGRSSDIWSFGATLIEMGTLLSLSLSLSLFLLSSSV